MLAPIESKVDAQRVCQGSGEQGLSEYMLYNEVVTARLSTARLNSHAASQSSPDLSAAPPDLRAMCRLAAGLCNRNHTMIKLVGAAMLAVTVGVSAQDHGQYRDFRLGASLTSVAGLTGTPISDARLIHERPVLMQELRWIPSQSTSDHKPSPAAPCCSRSSSASTRTNSP